jgi:guanosine-3',5'-bis(diphosphate) 3'-pyrophosphohydrolase
MPDLAFLLRAVAFSAHRHRDQRRKGADASPYVNHPIDVASVLANVGGVTDVAVLAAAVLHDTVEDTGTRPEEIEAEFGPEVSRLVEEVTDDRSLPKAERKRRQAEHAPHLSSGAKEIKLGDKICNVADLVRDPPAGWSAERRAEYVEWAERVVAGCRGTNPALERRFDEVAREARAASS